MKILHLSDLHYKQLKKFQDDQDDLIGKLTIEFIKEKGSIDYILFTGDLANDGSSEDNLNIAYNKLLKKTSEVLMVSDSNIFICAGNHDLHQNQEMTAIRSEFERIKTIENLDDFVKDENDRQFKESLINFANYLNFQNHLPKEKEDIIKTLFTIQKRKYKENSIGIVTLNSAWRSIDSEKDRGNLLYPISFLKQIINHIKDCDFRMILMHHSISDFKEFIAAEMEDLIFKNFHILLSGHYHKQKTSLNFTSNNGIFCTTAPAALTKSDHHGNIGYSIYDIDIDTYNVNIKCVFYNEHTSSFDIIENQEQTIPTDKIKQEQNKLRQTFKKRYFEELENANKLFVSNSEPDNSNDFIKLFTEPILKSKSKSELASNKGKEEPIIPLNTIIGNQDCFIVFGKDKSGRTSLLYKAKLELLNKFNLYKQIPFYIDCKIIKHNENQIDIIGLLKKYYEVNRSKIIELSNNYKICLLIDNYDPLFSQMYDAITSFTKEFSNSRFIICAEDTILRSYNTLVLDSITCNKLFIHEITRKEIRTLTKKWSRIPQEKREVVIEKIMEIFSQLNMPTSYWTVSLFLWIFEKTNEANFHNNFELIQLYIDGLLERKKLALDKSSKISYDDFKAFLGALAHFLIKEHHNNNCTSSYADIINFTENYRNHRKRFVIRVEDVINLLLERGIIKRDSNDGYSFRLNGVFEYFLAYHMTEDETFKNDVINDNHFYLSFGNEFELYSGFNKKDIEFVKKIFNKTDNIFNELNQKYSFQKTDKYFISKIVEIFDISLPIQQLSQQEEAVLSPEEKDALLDEMSPLIKEEDVKQKRYYEEIENNEDNLEKALFILSRVYRNSSLSDEKLEDNILDFIINSACNLGFLLIDETEQSDEKSLIDVTDETKEKLILKLVANYMPLVVQAFLFDALMQNNLERIIKEKIQNLIKDPDNNQFKIFILYFLLIDLDAKNSKKYIEDVIEKVKLGILKQSILLKLYMYLMLKSHGNIEFEEFLKRKIEKLSKIINHKADIDKINVEITKKQRIAILKKNNEAMDNDD